MLSDEFPYELGVAVLGIDCERLAIILDRDGGVAGNENRLAQAVPGIGGVGMVLRVRQQDRDRLRIELLGEQRVAEPSLPSAVLSWASFCDPTILPKLCPTAKEKTAQDRTK